MYCFFINKQLDLTYDADRCIRGVAWDGPWILIGHPKCHPIGYLPDKMQDFSWNQLFDK